MTQKLLPLLMGRYLNTLVQVAPRVAGAHGFRLFCYPFRPPIRPHQKEFLSTGVDRRIRIGGNDIQLYRWGHGPKKILFLHGWQSHTYRWKPFIESFSHDEYTLYSLDAPGHGLSSGSMLHVPMYSGVISEVFGILGTFDAIIAHSLGAFSVLHTAYHAGDVPAGKLVLLAPPGEASEFFRFYTDTLDLNLKCASAIKSHFETTIRFPVDYFSAPSFAGALARPGLIIHDKGDQETVYGNAVAIHRSWPKSELLLTEGLGHNLKHPDIPKKVAAFVAGKKSEVESVETN